MVIRVSADQIYRAYELRMWMIWIPTLTLLAVALYFVLPMPNGLGVLTMIIFGVFTAIALIDWGTSEISASRAEAAQQG